MIFCVQKTITCNLTTSLDSPGIEKQLVADWTRLDFSNTDAITPDFDWSQTEEMPHRPWNNGPHHVTMGDLQLTSSFDEIGAHTFDRTL